MSKLVLTLTTSLASPAPGTEPLLTEETQWVDFDVDVKVERWRKTQVKVEVEVVEKEEERRRSIADEGGGCGVHQCVSAFTKQME